MLPLSELLRQLVALLIRKRHHSDPQLQWMSQNCVPRQREKIKAPVRKTPRLQGTKFTRMDIEVTTTAGGQNRSLISS